MTSATEIVFVLSDKPETRGHSAKPFKPHRHARSDRCPSGKDAIERLASDGEISSSLADGELQCRQNVVAQESAGVFWGVIRWFWLFCHTAVTRHATK